MKFKLHLNYQENNCPTKCTPLRLFSRYAPGSGFGCTQKTALMACNNRLSSVRFQLQAYGCLWSNYPWNPTPRVSPQGLHLFLSSDVRQMCTYFKFNYYTLHATNSGSHSKSEQRPSIQMGQAQSFHEEGRYKTPYHNSWLAIQNLR